MVRGVVALAAHAAVLGAPPAASGFRTDPPPPSDSLPVWSPDDSAIVFWSFRSLGLRVVEPDGGRERALGLPFGVLSPDWRWLAYVDFAKPPVIELMRPDGSERRTLVAGGQPSWAPDGTRLALSASSSVYTIRTDGSDLRELVTQADTPLWSRDGSWIAFRHLAPLVDRTDFGIAPADGTQVRARAQARGARVLARIDRVVARRRDRRALPGAGGSVWLIRTRDLRARRVPLPVRGSKGEWSPNGRNILFAGQGIWRLDVRSGRSTKLARFGFDPTYS